MSVFKIMSIKINYTIKFANNLSSNLILFVNENFHINGLKKIISNDEFSYISDLLKTSDLKKNILFLLLRVFFQRKK